MCKRQVHRQRTKARDIAKLWLTIPMMRKAQNNKCCICFKPFGNTDSGITVDHVRPVSEAGGNAGNILLAHQSCNNQKGNNPPSEETLRMLMYVNWMFGFMAKHECYEFDMRVISGARRHYINLSRRLKESEKFKHQPEQQISRRMIVVQMEELVRMQQVWDQFHYRASIAENIF